MRIYKYIVNRPKLSATLLLLVAYSATYLIYILNQTGSCINFNPFYNQPIDRIFYIVFFSIASWFAYVNYALNKEKAKNETSRDQYNFYYDQIKDFPSIVPIKITDDLVINSDNITNLYSQIWVKNSQSYDEQKILRNIFNEIQELFRLSEELSFFKKINDFNKVLERNESYKKLCLKIKRISPTTYKDISSIKSYLDDDQLATVYIKKINFMLDVDNDTNLTVLDKTRLIKRLYDPSVRNIVAFRRSNTLFSISPKFDMHNDSSIKVNHIHRKTVSRINEIHNDYKL